MKKRASSFVKQAKRFFGVAQEKPPEGGFKPKTFYQSWLSDKGAFPIMAVLVVSVALPLGFAVYKVSTDPDARFHKALRKNIFRDDPKGKAQ